MLLGLIRDDQWELRVNVAPHIALGTVRKVTPPFSHALATRLITSLCFVP